MRKLIVTGVLGLVSFLGAVATLEGSGQPTAGPVPTDGSGICASCW
jgi:hypothetical protein